MAPRTAQRCDRKTRRVEAGAGPLKAGRLQQRPRVCRRACSARPAPPHRAARPEGQGRLTAGWQVAPGRAGLRSRAQEVSLSLRQLSPACCGRRLPRRRRRSPVRSRHAVGCMSSNRLYSPRPPAPPSSPPAAVTVPACKLLAGNKRLRSGRAGASPPPPHSTARRSLEVWGWRRLSSPFPRRRAAPRRPARAAPLEAPEREAESPGEEGGGGAGAGAGKRSDPSGQAGGGGGDWRPRQRRRGFGAVPGEGAWAPSRQPQTRAPALPGPRERPAPERARGGERPGAAPRKSPDKGEPRPPPAGPAPCGRRRVPARPAPSPAQGRVNARLLHPAGAVWQGPLGAPSAGRVAPAAVGACLTLPPKAVRVPPMSPLAQPCWAQQHSSLKPRTSRRPKEHGHVQRPSYWIHSRHLLSPFS